MSVEVARQRYLAELPRFESAALVAKEYLDAIARLAGVHATTEARAKEPASFIKKLHLKKYLDPWLEVTDKVGARLIVDTLHDLRRVRSIFQDASQCPLRVLSLEDKSDDAAEWLLFYPGIHVQIEIPECFTSDGEQIQCEVQLRTKAQDLWSVPSHKLVYKPLLDPSSETKRRVMRLSVLVEIFDQEVNEAMNEVAQLPGYAEARLLALAEQHYFSFVGEPGEVDLSIDTLRLIRPVIEHAQFDDYEDALRQFVGVNRNKLSQAYQTYGPYSAFAAEFAYWMMSQPESMIVFHLADARPMLLANAVEGTDIERAVRELYAIWGTAFPVAA
jgi:ppGpp synthetase/RelA/SpoT-type nucleotidyltranferase